MLKLAARSWLAIRVTNALDGSVAPEIRPSVFSRLPKKRAHTRRLAIALAVATSLPLASGCTSCSIANDKSPYFGTIERKGKDVHTFYVNNGGEPEYLDPAMAHDTASGSLIQSLFEGLVAYGPDAEPTPAVATSWDQSSDNRFFRFHLRDDAKWSDGKPVTAHDFEYAWKRVLSPKTASQAAPNLYSLLNGEDFNLGRLKSSKSDAGLLKSASATSPKISTLSKGTALRVLAHSPMKVAAAIKPFDAAPEHVERLTYDPPSPKTKAPEQMTVDGVAHGPSEDGAWKGHEVVVVERLGPVRCNEEDDFFFRVADGDKTGVLPGCMLAEAGAKQTFALVANLEHLPTFKADSPISAARTEPVGWVDTALLEDDPSVLGVRATDDRTLEVELKGPTPFFLDLACAPTLFPVRRDLIEKFEARHEPDLWTRPENMISNGPFMLDEWKFRYEITMKRDPHHYLFAKLKIHRVVELEVEEYLQTMSLYQAGEIDYIGENLTLPPDYIKFLSTKKDFKKSDYLATYWYEFNTNKAPTDNVLVRRALNLAIDKKQLIDKVVLGGQAAATHYVPDLTGLGYSAQVEADRKAGVDPFATPDSVFNPERARELLGEAGYKVVKDGDGYRADGIPPVEILYNTSEGHKKIAVAIQDMWKRHLGISVTLRNEEWKVMLKNVRDRNFQVVRFGWVADYNHPHTYLDTFLSFSPNNRTGWANPSFDALLAKAAAMADPTESIKLYREAEKIAVDAMPKMPLYFYTKLALLKPYVKGFHFNVRNEQLVKYLWIDEGWEGSSNNDPAYPVESFAKPGAY